MRLFIAIEGVEGSGKSTLQKSLSLELEKLGIETLMTREPGGSALGKILREILLKRECGEIDSLSELFLFAADRAEHINTVILPALKQNRTVICDRFIYSTVAYQGFARGINLSVIRKVNDLATNGTLPEIVLLLDLDPSLGLNRTAKRALENEGDGITSFEREKFEFHTKVREGFLVQAKEEPKRFVVIDASRPKEHILLEALNVIKTRIGVPRL